MIADVRPAPHSFLITQPHNGPSVKVLIIEDDGGIAAQLAESVRQAGWKPAVRRDGQEGLQAALEGSWAMILLDVMLPGIDGWEVCRRVRAAGMDTAILMLTARDDVEDRVKGLDLGADDYLPKPFEAAELLARMRALARRQAHIKSGRIELGDLVLDSRAQTAERAGQPLKLTPREFSLLEALARHEGQVLTREAILERIWNNDEALPNTVNFHMASLRKKLDQDHEVKLIHTVHGLGYMLRRPA